KVATASLPVIPKALNWADNDGMVLAIALSSTCPLLPATVSICKASFIPDGLISKDVCSETAACARSEMFAFCDVAVLPKDTSILRAVSPSTPAATRTPMASSNSDPDCPVFFVVASTNFCRDFSCLEVNPAVLPISTSRAWNSDASLFQDANTPTTTPAAAVAAPATTANFAPTDVSITRSPPAFFFDLDSP